MRSAIAAVVVGSLAGLLGAYVMHDELPGARSAPSSPPSAPSPSASPVDRPASAPRGAFPAPPDPEAKVASRGDREADSSLAGDEPRTPALSEIDVIKQELYQLDIDSIHELDQLDAFVDLGDTDPRDLWNTDWSGVDDFKRHTDGLKLERWSDGRYVFIPDREKQLAYTFYENMGVYEYDAGKQEFVSEIDYYGKPIRNVVKFLRDDVMVTMTVSGEKVDLNIYELRPEEGDR